MLKIAIASLAAASVEASAQQVALEPSGKWVVSGEEGLCVLSRAYGSPADERQLAIRPMGSEERTEVVLLSARRGSDLRVGTGTVRLDEGSRASSSFVEQRYGKAGQRLTTITVDRNLAHDLATAQTLTVEAGTQNVTFRIVHPAPALRALSQCEDLLLRKWGVDPVAYRAEAEHAKFKDSGSIGPDQYPSAALKRDAQGRTVTVLSIGADGRVGSCRVVSTSGNEDLDRATCQAALHRMHFTPAIGPGGKPITASYILPVRWALPLD